MKTARIGVVALCLSAGMPGFAAAVDLNGLYEGAVYVGSSPLFDCEVASTQVGSALSMNIDCPPGDFFVSGSIDTGTGDFSLSGTCDSGNSAVTFDGTGAPDGTSFTGDLACGPVFPFTLSATRVSINICGDSVIQSPEECDDGNEIDGDCCSSTCTLEPLGSSCPAGPCVIRECNGAGTCEYIGPKPAGTPCNGGACSYAECDGTLGLCELTTPFPCDGCSTCDPSRGCVGTPMECTEPSDNRSKVTIKNQDNDSKDRVVSIWGKGPEVDLADFGDPTASTNYRACVFVSDPLNPGLRSVSAVEAPAGAGWSAKSNGFKYKSGSTKILLKAGPDGRPKIKVAAKGVSAGVAESLRRNGQYYAHPVPEVPDGFPELLMGPPARIEIRADNGQCWAADLDDPKKVSEKKLVVRP